MWKKSLSEKRMLKLEHELKKKTEYMFSEREETISTLNGGPLDIVEKFTYLGSSGSSTKNDFNYLPREGMDCYR